MTPSEHAKQIVRAHVEQSRGNCTDGLAILRLEEAIASALAAQPSTGDAHRCSGCGHRWGQEKAHQQFRATSGAELCGDCWRKAQPLVHAEASALAEKAPFTADSFQWRCSCGASNTVGSECCAACHRVKPLPSRKKELEASALAHASHGDCECDGCKTLAHASTAHDEAPPPVAKARPFSEWHDDYHDVLWWHFPIQEPPYVGSPLCCDWPFSESDESALGWMRLPVPDTKG